MLKLMYFASVRETVGVACEDIELPAGVRDVEGLRTYLAARGKPWDYLGYVNNLRAAVNQDMAEDDAKVVDGDEIAFFPPVTGG